MTLREGLALRGHLDVKTGMYHPIILYLIQSMNTGMKVIHQEDPEVSL